MEKKKPILVEKHGKKWTYKLASTSTESSPSSQESAAAQEKSEKTEEDKIPVLTALKKSKKGYTKKNSSQLKPVLLAVMSAVIIGSVLGFTLIRMFVQVDSPNGSNTTMPAQGQVNNGNNTPVTATTETYTLDPLHAYISQAGIFSEEANAVEWQENYTQMNIPTVMWERDNQFFLITSVAPTKELGQSIAQTLSEEGSVEVYVKEWSTNDGEVDLTEEEIAWVNEFHSFWNTELTNQVTATDPITNDSIQSLLDGAPNEAPTIQPLIDTLNETSGEPSSVQLLHLMHEYEILLQ